MKEISIDDTKKMELELLKKVAAFCDDNKLRYFIYAGTYIGAIRHKGFIPWDDDIDIAMPRTDYEKFLNIFSAEDCYVLTWRKDNNYLLPFAKVCDTRTVLKENADFGEELGVNIDVFPLDGLPSNASRLKRRVNFMKRCFSMQVGATLTDPSNRALGKRIVINLIKAFYRVIPIQHYHTGRTIKYAQKYDFDESEYVASLVWGYGMKEVIKRENLFPLRKLQFEDAEFWAPRTDECLINAYGDYMQFPPEEERVYKHSVKVFWKE